VIPDVAIYGFHVAFYASFLIRMLPRPPEADSPLAEGEVARAEENREARFSRTLVAVHMAGFGATYFGINNAVFGHQVVELFPYAHEVGAALLALATVFAVWALLSFRSWRFRAAIEKGHVLATGGAFAWVRNPIYLGMDFLALGSVVWMPSIAGLIGLVFVCVGGDVRARAEERVLEASFGQPYRDYKARVKRFVPGIY
jgi:protein-S-isoprenylcysteine O-methyltransferase Ste14